MSLSKNQTRFLRGLCHDLKPVVMLGQKGLTDAVMNELEAALDHHELVKIKLSVDDRDARKRIIDDICRQAQAELVQTIGKTMAVFRRNIKKPVIQLPKA